MEFNNSFFVSPPMEYRDAPFWSWNGKMTKEELERQMEIFCQMGFGGVHLHPRTGMDIEYLSDEYMDMVEVCIKKAEELGMFIYLYDEDRWPSGFAGGLVTKNPDYRAKHLLLSKHSYQERQGSCAPDFFSVTSHRTGNGKLIACYDVILSEDGGLKSYKTINEKAVSEGEKWYAYIETADCSPWFNGYTNADLFNKEAVEEFLRTTHNKYYERFGRYFGNTIPSIFTDEPQVTFKRMLSEPFADEDILLPWTVDFEDTYEKCYGYSIVKHLPELVWNNDSSRKTRYDYFEHSTDRFMNSFLYTYRDWCHTHNLKFTGHFLEGKPRAQATSVGDTMRMYDAEDIPGVDLLCDNTEVYYQMKLTQSVMRQKAAKQMLCEIYGVNGWNFGFTDYMFEGNWAAACGVNLRAHHLSMYTMAGEGKRDYPGSIGYQAPWCEKYRVVEDYFARLNYILQTGTPIVKIGVINPIESTWLTYGNKAESVEDQIRADESFSSITDRLLLDGYDFDFISEALLPNQLNIKDKRPYVGQMSYNTVIVPDCECLRKSTIEFLKICVDSGVQVIFTGNIPDSARTLLRITETVLPDSERFEMLIKRDRIVEICDASGEHTRNLLHQLRRDGDNLYLFIAPIEKPVKGNVKARDITVKIKGIYSAAAMDLYNGSFECVDSRACGEYTEIKCKLYDFGAVLIRLNGIGEEACRTENCEKREVKAEITGYELSEPNVLLLDTAVWQLSDGEINTEEEILRLDNSVRRQLGLEERRDVMTQPWKIEPGDTGETLKLYFSFESEIKVEETLLAIEEPQNITIKFNGIAVNNNPIGYYADRDIKTVRLPEIQQGKNILELTIQYTTKTNVEWCYILGSFGVRLEGNTKIITALPQRIATGDLVKQGFPFYGGNVDYRIKTEGGNALSVEVSDYEGALVSVEHSGEEQNIIGAPYTVQLKNRKCTGELTLRLYGTRYNTFGALHNCDPNNRHKSHPNDWRTSGEKWTKQYVLKPFGIMNMKVREAIHE